MSARTRGDNTGNTLEAFSLSAIPVFHKVRLMERGHIRRRIVAGDGPGNLEEIRQEVRTFTFPGPVGACSAEGLEFPDAEQERVRVLARVNRSRVLMGFTLGDILPPPLTRERHAHLWPIKGKGIAHARDAQRLTYLRRWKRAPLRAAPSWETGDRFPVLSRFRKFPGLFPLAADLPKLGKVNAGGENAPTAYFEQLGTARNRVRSSSPRWRGTARHKRRQSRSAQTFAFTLDARSKAQYQAHWEQQEKLSAAARRRRTRGEVLGSTPADFVRIYLELYGLAKRKRSDRTLWMLRRDFRRRVSAAVKTDMNWLREMLRLLREAQAEQDTYAGFIGLTHVEAFRVYLRELSHREPHAERVPRPPDLLPLPPSAPLAPPAP